MNSNWVNTESVVNRIPDLAVPRTQIPNSAVGHFSDLGLLATFHAVLKKMGRAA